MNKKKKALLVRPILFLLAAAVLLLVSTVGSTRAALTYYSENYGMEVQLASIGVSLLERGSGEERVAAARGGQDAEGAAGILLADLPAEEELVLGKEYPEELYVRNTGEIDSYVRVILWKSWKGPNGQKDTGLSPDLIDLELNLSADGWVRDPAASTAERTVLYYKKVLPGDSESDGSGGVTEPLCRSFCIDPSLREQVVTTTVDTDGSGNQVIRTEYAYDGCSFELKAEVDAVQARSAEDAVKSAWGVDVEIAEDGTLFLPGESIEDLKRENP